MVGQSKKQKFFGPRSSSVTSFGFFAVLSVLMIIIDHQMRMMEPVRSGLSAFSETIFSTIEAPARIADNVSDRFRSKATLAKENEDLKVEIEKSKLLSSRLSSLEEENRVLKQMLMQRKLSPADSEMFKVRRIISDGFTQRYQIDGGAEQGLAVGMPVLSERGLAGQLIHVSPKSSFVQLIQDKNQEVPVLFEKSGIRGIVQGVGESQKLVSRDLPYTDKIQVGEVAVTSGLDGVYPKGIPVGVVASVAPIESGSYSEVVLESPKSITDQDYVLVLRVDPKVEFIAEEDGPIDEQVRRRPPR